MSQVKRMIAITEPYPDGQRVTGIAIEYEKEIKNDALDVSDFAVENRTVCRVYANDEAAFAKEGKDGRFVIVRLFSGDEGCQTVQRPERPKRPKGQEGPGGPGGPGPGGPIDLCSKRKQIALTVSQKGELTTVSGEKVAGFSDRKTDGEYNMLVDEFEQFELNGMKYSLFTPKNCDASQRYPLVLFIPDATGKGDDPRISLEQGNGAVNFAGDRDQSRHPAFVLAPQYSWDGPLTRDDFTTNSEAIEVIHDIVAHVMETYPIDADRVYTTGQSMGCMASCELNVRYPDLFAASLLVAGQWNPETMACLYRKNFWIFVSEHDAKAYPGMTAVLDAMKAQGGVVEQYRWDAKAGAEELNAAVLGAANSGVNLRFTVFEGDSVVPEGEEKGPGSNHVNTWPVVYGIDAVRDWLFTQTKK